MSREAHEVPDAFRTRLHEVAVDVAMPTAPGLDDAIALGEELLAAGLGGPETLAVAALRKGSARSDVEQAVRAMLSAFGLDVPAAQDEAGRYRLVLWLFGHAGLAYRRFEGPFYARVLHQGRRGELERALLDLAGEQDRTSDSSVQLAIRERMRAVVRQSI